jgi:hypothetical protein
VHPLVDAGLIPLLLTHLSSHHHLKFVVAIYQIFCDIANASEHYLTLISSLGLISQLMKIYQSDDNFLREFFSLISLESLIYSSVHDLAPFLQFILKNLSYYRHLFHHMLRHPPSILFDALIEANLLPDILEMIVNDEFDLSLTRDLLRLIFEHHAFHIPLNPQVVSSFGSRACQDNKKMEIIGPYLSKLVTSCHNLNQIIGIGLIPSLLTCRAENNEHNIRCLLTITKHSVKLIRRPDRDLFLDHLVDSGLTLYLMESMIAKYSKNKETFDTFTELTHLSVPDQDLVSLIGDIVDVLQSLMRANPRYLESVDEFDLPDQLISLLYSEFEM